MIKSESREHPIYMYLEAYKIAQIFLYIELIIIVYFLAEKIDAVIMKVIV